MNRWRVDVEIHSKPQDCTASTVGVIPQIIRLGREVLLGESVGYALMLGIAMPVRKLLIGRCVGVRVGRTLRRTVRVVEIIHRLLDGWLCSGYVRDRICVVLREHGWTEVRSTLNLCHSRSLCDGAVRKHRRRVVRNASVAVWH